MQSYKPPERASTGVEGLDIILHGGLPRNRLYMIEGAGGTGKTTLGLQFCIAGISQGEKAMYISLSETEQELRQVIGSHGWSTKGLEILSFTDDDEDMPGEEYTLFHPSEVELGQSTKRLLEAVEKARPSRLVLDTLAGLRLMAEDTLRYRRQMQSLRGFLTSRGCTVLILDETELHKSIIFQPRSMYHGIIRLETNIPEYGPERRRVLVKKLRGITYISGYHDLRMVTGGLQVFPRLVAASHPSVNRDSELLSSGLKEIDQLLGQGVHRGSSALIMGAAGTGKSTLALQYCLAAAERGEKVVYFLFDEDVDTLFARGRGLGMDPSPYADRGLLVFQQIDPAEMTPGEFAHNLRYMVTNKDIHLVVIDSLSGYLYSMPQARFLNLHLHELMTYLGNQGVTTLMTLIQHGLVGEHVETPGELSFLADTLILLRYFEARGEVRKALSVLKKRAGPHETYIRELIMADNQGIRVGEPLTDFQGVLTGVPIYTAPQESPQLLNKR